MTPSDRLDATFAALDAAVEHQLTRNGMDLCRTEWMTTPTITWADARFGRNTQMNNSAGRTKRQGMVVLMRR